MEKTSDSNVQVVLLAHSFGGIMTHHFIVDFVDTNWKQKYVECFLPVAVLWAGSVDCLIQFTTGNNTGIPFENRKLAAKMLRSWESITATLPVPGVVTSRDHGKDVVARIGFREFTTNNISELVQYVAGNDARDMYLAGTRHNSMSLETPEVNVFAAVSLGIPTTTCIDMKNCKYTKDLTSVDSIDTKGYGDGSVNCASLLRSNIWESSKDFFYKLYEVEKIGHVEILSNKIITEIISNINEHKLITV